MKALITLLFITLPIFNEAKWELAKDQNGIKIFTRKAEGSEYKEFKALTKFKTTKEKLITEFSNITAMAEWYDMVEKVELLKKVSDNEAIYKIYFDFPAFTTDRYSTIKASIIKEASTGTIRVNSAYFPIDHKKETDRIMIKNMHSYWLIKGEDNNLSVEHSGYLDPAGSIPKWMFNSGLSDGPYRTLVNLKKRLEK